MGLWRGDERPQAAFYVLRVPAPADGPDGCEMWRASVVSLQMVGPFGLLSLTLSACFLEMPFCLRKGKRGEQVNGTEASKQEALPTLQVYLHLFQPDNDQEVGETGQLAATGLDST